APWRLHQFFRSDPGRRSVHILSGPAYVLHGILAPDLRHRARRHRHLFPERPDGRPRCAPAVGGMRILQADGVRKFYGAFCALAGVSRSIGEGEHASIIGPNGAGKTTLVNVLTGLLSPTAGSVTFHGRDIARFDPVRLSRLGMARSFQ